MQKLSHNDAFSLFARHAGISDFESYPTLRLHGEGIVKKCDGLPLALKALGSLLRTKTDEEDWKQLLNNEIWTLEDGGGILPALRLSYYDLSARLKQLFAYCCLIPKDYVFEKDDLILLWMAEGFLHISATNKSMERLGEECFQELLSRSFFQHVPDDESSFVMHDLMNDLATFVAGEFYSRLDIDVEKNTRKEAFKKNLVRCKLPNNIQELEIVSISSWKNLKSINELTCSSIESFPAADLPNLTSLTHLTIINCKSMEVDSFGLWPPKLGFLQIGGLKKPISKLGPQNFPPSLVDLTLWGGSAEEEDDVSSGSQLSHMLPPTPHLPPTS
ncbi:NB-ARC domains-containing protein [Tanacetum coccineum]